MTALTNTTTGNTALDFAPSMTFHNAPNPWIRELGTQLNHYVTAAIDRDLTLVPATATLFRLTALYLAIESDLNRGHRDIHTTCQKIVNTITILDRRLNGPTPPNEIIVLTRE